MTKVKSTQIGVTFSRDDLDVLEALNEINAKTGVPVSVLIRKSVRAALMEDAEALNSLRAFKGFCRPVHLAGPSEKATG